MIVACPKCKARYKVDDAKIGDEGLKLRCSKCQSVFKVVKRPGEAQAPAAPPVPPVAAPKPPTAPVQPKPAAPAPPAPKPVAPPIPPKPVVAAPAPPPPPPPPSPYAGFEILLAAESGPARDQLEQVIKANQMVPILTADGIEALDIIKRKLPKAAILDVYLPKLLGFELCELVKNDDDLKTLPVILLAAQLNSHRFKRSPQSLYGADGYLEIKDIPTMTIDMLNDLLSGHAARKSKAEPDIFAHEGLETPPEPQEIAAPPAPPVVVPPIAAPPPIVPVITPPKLVAPTPIPVPPVAPVIPVPKPAAPSLPPQPQFVAPPPPPQVIPPARPPVPPSPPPVVQAPPVAPIPRPVAPPITAPVIPQAQAPVVEPELDVPPEEKAEHEKAKRLARIIVSDIQLYNQEAVMEGVRNGKFYDLLAKDIGDARRLYTQRVPEHIRSKTNYLEDTIEALIERKRKEMGLA